MGGGPAPEAPAGSEVATLDPAQLPVASVFWPLQGSLWSPEETVGLSLPQGEGCGRGDPWVGGGGGVRRGKSEKEPWGVSEGRRRVPFLPAWFAVSTGCQRE